MTAENPPTPRFFYESCQREWLASWAIGPDAGGGRAFDEQEHPYRTCFQRDRDRVVHCSAFRRLDFKTQVFVPHEHDHFRTRLTHTLEVAQIARSLGRALRLNEDLIEAVALAHDLGHPPFGHAGETVLDELMADHGRFEHNRQSLRIVDYLEHPYPQFRGLNLTRPVRECLAKHTSAYDTPICQQFDPALFGPMEGQLVDLADEIAYTSADLDDALAAGWISLDQLGPLALWRRAWDIAEADAPQAKTVHKRIRACKGVLAAMADDLISATTVQVASFAIASVDDVRQADGRCVTLSGELARDVRQMQNFLLDEVYLCDANAAHNRRGRRIITELFNLYVSDANLLPERYRRRLDREGLHRVTCDYIAGMTDRFCRNEHARLTG